MPKLQTQRLTLAIFLALCLAAAPATRPASEHCDLAKPMPMALFHENKFSDVIDFLRETTGANLFVDWDTVKKLGGSPDARISMDHESIGLGAVLADAVEQVQTKEPLVFGVVGHVIVISDDAGLKSL